MLSISKFVWFSAIITFADSIISCYAKPNNMNALNTATTSDIKNILEELGIHKERVEDLEPIEMRMLIPYLHLKLKLSQISQDTLQDKLQSKEDQLLAVEALLDVNEEVKKFLEEAYPNWAVHRNPKNTSEEIWKLVFCNWQEPRVVALKAYLKENNLSEKNFIEAINSKLMHWGLRPEDKPPAYESLKKKNSHNAEIALNVILYMALGNLSKIAGNESIKEEALNEMKENSQRYRLLRILSIEPFRSEELLAEEFKAFAACKNLKEPLSIFIPDKNIKNLPKSNKGVYVLFDSAEKAIAFFNGRDNMDFYNDERNSMYLADINNDALWGGKCYIMIKIQSKKYNKDEAENSNTTPRPISTTDVLDYVTENLSNLSTIRNIWYLTKEKSVILRFEKFDHTLMAYQLVKNKYASIGDITVQNNIPGLNSYNTLTFTPTTPDPTEKHVYHVKDDADLEQQLRIAVSKLIVIHFFGAWFEKSELFNLELEALSAVQTDVVFMKINAFECKKLAQTYGVSSVPTFILIKNKNKVCSLLGTSVKFLKQNLHK